MYDRNHLIEQTDPELFRAIQLENARQEHHIELIASENYASPAVMAAQGTQLTNKYAEGYPGKRYYGGCEYVDIAEQLAIERVKQIFGADCANVQPHCGASANEAVFLAFLKPGDTLMGMSLAEGGLKLYVGAGNNETDGGYAGKVMNEHARLTQVAKGRAIPPSQGNQAAIVPAVSQPPQEQGGEKVLAYLGL